MTQPALTLFSTHALPQRCPSDRLPRALDEVQPKNRRFTDPRLYLAPLALHGRLSDGWDLDAAAEPGGSVAEHLITVEDDALHGADWPTFLGPKWTGQALTGSNRPARLPLVWLNGPFSTPPGWPTRTGWKEAWVSRAQEQARLGLIVWVLFPFTVLPAIAQLEAATDCTITTSGWRAAFRSPCGLEQDAPKQDAYLLARLTPRGYRDSLTGTCWRLLESGLVVPAVRGMRGGETFDTRWRDA